jgi:hypothetical protein
MPRLAALIPVLVFAVLIGLLVTADRWTRAAPRPEAPADDQPNKAERIMMDWDAKAEPVAFDAKRAMGYLDDICKLGPRMSGTDAMTKQQELVEKHFTKLGGKVTYQKFKAKQNSVRQPVEMANMLVSWKPEEKRRVILCSHYDTRPKADQETDPKKRKEPIVSANDGGSGVALLMELANHMNKLPANVGVDFVFFDGEEYVFERNDDYFFGSRHFGEQYTKTRKESGQVYLGAILLDMIAGKDLRLPVEQNSWTSASPLVEDVYKIAADLKADAFRRKEFSKTPVEDDHVMLNRHRIPAIDLIDFDYKHWHRLTDVPENCSGENMEQVARVLSVWLQRVK